MRPAIRDGLILLAAVVLVYSTLSLTLAANNALLRLLAGQTGLTVDEVRPSLMRLYTAFLMAALGAWFATLAALKRATRRFVILLPFLGVLLYLLVTNQLARWTHPHDPTRSPLWLWPIEREHLMKYAFLGWLVWRALRHFVSGPALYPAAFTVALLIALGDEGLQGSPLHPGREFDLRDVGYNAFSAATGLVVHWTLKRPG